MEDSNLRGIYEDKLQGDVKDSDFFHRQNLRFVGSAIKGSCSYCFNERVSELYQHRVVLRLFYLEDGKFVTSLRAVFGQLCRRVHMDRRAILCIVSKTLAGSMNGQTWIDHPLDFGRERWQNFSDMLIFLMKILMRNRRK